MDTIFKRRSIRRYLDKPVPRDLLDKLLKAAMRAPSAGNEQPWEFIVLQSRGALAAASKISPYATPLLQAPLAVVVCGNLERCKFAGEAKDYWIQDCSAAIQNMLLEACYLGLGGVWLGIYPEADRVCALSNQLNLPENVIPLSIVSFGYPEETPEPMDTFQADRIHLEKW